MNNSSLSSRDIWTHGSSFPLTDVLKTCLSSLLFENLLSKELYLASPWITDFELFDNRYEDYSDLFPEFSDNSKIMLSDYLIKLSKRNKIRIITLNNARSLSFVKKQNIQHSTNIETRRAPDDFHEKGILSEFFYIEGSMNITDAGVRGGEKIIYHSTKGNKMPNKISEAYLEFNRLWEHCSCL